MSVAEMSDDALSDLTDDEEVSAQFATRRSESSREKAVFRYLHPWTRVNRPAFLHRTAFPHGDDSVRQPATCSDTALTSFAQLGAWRLGARRVFVTLLSTSVEYVLSEATKSTSLQYGSVEERRDAAWIGTCSFPRSEGLNDLAIDSWRRASELRDIPAESDFYYIDGLSPHWYILSDVRNHPECMSRPFASRAPWLRFFCAVPIRDMHGNVVGSYTVTDDKPRYGISVQELAFLEDMADTVTDHLQNTLLKAQSERSERLIQGLYIFNDGRDSLRHWWLGQEKTRTRRAGRRLLKHKTSDEDAKRLAKEFGPQNQCDRPGPSAFLGRGGTGAHTTARSNSAAAKDRATEDVATHDFDVRPDRSPASRPAFVGESVAGDKAVKTVQKERRCTSAESARHTKGTNEDSSKVFDLTEASRRAYARASNLMREAINAEGVVLVEANFASTRTKQSRKSSIKSISSGATELSSSSGGPNDRGAGAGAGAGARESSGTSDSDNHSGEAFCRLHAFSTRSKSTTIGSHVSRHRFQLSQSHLATLIRHYPRGKVFNFHENGEVYSSSGEENTTASGEDAQCKESVPTRSACKRQARHAAHLGKVMIGARTVAFYPLWDNSLERWRSCFFVWSTTPLRFFDPIEDITYLAAFGHSVIAELARLEMVASDRAKGTFISSVSHELRSPLHGILGGVEFLLTSELSPFQAEMATTISMAGRTLLETINHILDYSKIANLTRTQREVRASADLFRQRSNILGDGDEIGVTQQVDLAKLTEQAIETVVAAHTFETAANIKEAPSSSNESGSLESTTGMYFRRQAAGSVSVILDFTWRENWMIEIPPGSWLRIITNLVGNALKYTHEGTITVKLAVENNSDDDDDDGVETGDVKLLIEDTGIGMSADFLANGFYTPFQQADSLSTGTGLGLSIVKQIVRDLRATMDVQSTAGKGTAIAVSLPVRFLRRSTLEPGDRDLDGAIRKLNLQHFHIHKPAADSSRLTPQEGDRVAAVAASVHNVVADWLHCEVLTEEPIRSAAPKAAIYAMSHADLELLASSQPESLSAMLSELATQQNQLMILSCSAIPASKTSLSGNSPIEPIFVHQPIGPRKLMHAIANATMASAQRTNEIEPVGSTFSPGAGTVRVARNDGFPWSSAKSVDARKPTIGSRERSKRRTRLKPERNSTSSSHSRSPSSSSTQSPSDLSPAVLTSPLTPGFQLSSTHADDHSDSTPPKVLIVEDNPVNSRLLSALMSKLRLPYECASNGLEALETYSASPSTFFLILMDISMPVMDGYTSTARIREVERRQRLTLCYIVALTGVSNAGARQQAFDSGVNEFYTKPVRMKDLSALIVQMQRSERPPI